MQQLAITSPIEPHLQSNKMLEPRRNGESICIIPPSPWYCYSPHGHCHVSHHVHLADGCGNSKRGRCFAMPTDEHAYVIATIKGQDSTCALQRHSKARYSPCHLQSDWQTCVCNLQYFEDIAEQRHNVPTQRKQRHVTAIEAQEGAEVFHNQDEPTVGVAKTWIHTHCRWAVPVVCTQLHGNQPMLAPSSITLQIPETVNAHIVTCPNSHLIWWALPSSRLQGVGAHRLRPNPPPKVLRHQ